MSDIKMSEVFGVDISFACQTIETKAFIDCSNSHGAAPIVGKQDFVRAAYIAIMSHDKLVEENLLLRDTLRYMGKGTLHPIDLGIMSNEVLNKVENL
jgi:hypothetical protein